MLQGDILIKNGKVFQPTLNFFDRGDVLIEGNKIKAVIKDKGSEPINVKKVIHADGCIVSSGLIDFHTHLFNGGTQIGVNPDAFLFPQGVTAAVDQGSSGAANFLSFYKDIIAPSEVKIYCFINVSSSGLTTLPTCFENLDPAQFDELQLKILFENYPEKIVGLKIRTTDKIVGKYGYTALKKAQEMARNFDCRLTVHTTDAPGNQNDLIRFFKPGDIYAHVYHGGHNPILDSTGKIVESIKDAKKGGIIFDTADGRDHYSFSVIKKCLKENFYPDLISTDLVRSNVFDKAVFGLPLVMSKYLNLGMKIEDVLKACTLVPAKILNQSKNFGTLLPGSIADIAIFRLENISLQMRDVYQGVLDLHTVIINKVTIANGKLVYVQLEYSPFIDEYR